MSSNQVTPIQFLRSSVTNKRPEPSKLLPGQGAVNTATSQPGFFFADSAGTGLVKIGPCFVGTEPPNFEGSVNPPGFLGNSTGELWLDENNVTNPALKIWNGTTWITVAGNALIHVDAPTTFTDPGVFGQVAMTPNFFYWYDGTRWQRVAPSPWVI